MATAELIANYTAACKEADSIRRCEGQICEVVAGSNDGYFIRAFGKSYRFASIECEKTIAKLFLAIVSIGPVCE